MYQPKMEKDIRCPLEYGLGVLDRKWNSQILCLMVHRGRVRYTDLRRDIPNISDAVLASVLKRLVKDKILVREQFDEIPPRVEYTLSEKGQSLIPIIQKICQWSIDYHEGEDWCTPSFCHGRQYGHTPKEK